MKIITLAILLLFSIQSCVPMLHTQIEINPARETNAYWKEGTATVKIHNRTDTEQMFIVSSEVITIAPRQKVKFFAPAGRYYISTSADTREWQIYGKSNNVFTFFQSQTE